MDYSEITKKLSKDINPQDIKLRVSEVLKNAGKYNNKEVYERCFASVDLTSLNTIDSSESIKRFARKAADFRSEFPHLPNMASLCVYPVFVDTVGLTLGDSEISITSVGGCFPSSQSYLEVKMLECSMAEENGADEIDIVMNLGLFADGQYDAAANEIEIIRQELDEGTLLKVIIESGVLGSLTEIRKAAVLTMAAGADFVKTSTGKNGVGATPEAVMVICDAVKDYFECTGEKIGVKVSGGIRTAEETAGYYAIVDSVLGQDWLTPQLFRIGASSLANDLLSKIEGKDINYF